MNRLRRVVAVLALCVPSSAYASECVGLSTATLLDVNDVVFTGVVTRIAPVARSQTGRGGAVVTVTFKVAGRYKTGAIDASSRSGELVLHQFASPGMTDYFHQYEVGRRYLVFAKDERKVATFALGSMKLPAIVSRACDAWDLATPMGRQRLEDLEEALP